MNALCSSRCGQYSGERPSTIRGWTIIPIRFWRSGAVQDELEQGGQHGQLFEDVANVSLT